MKYIFLSLLLSVATCTIGQKINKQFVSTQIAKKDFGKLAKQPYHIFAETRENPIHWNDSLKLSWLENDFTNQSFAIHARPDEYFVYQVGVWASNGDLNHLEINFSDLKSKDGKTILSKQINCFNAEGIDYHGKPFSKIINIEDGKVQALWVGVDLSGVAKGIYDGSATVLVNNKKKSIKIQLNVMGEAIEDHGYNSGNGLTRMNWLNSTVGINNEITKGFQPINRSGKTFKILGRSFVIGDDG